MLVDLSPNVRLIPLPCGCVAEMMTIEIHGQRILGCPWCECTFAEDDLEQWLENGHGIEQLRFTRQPCTLLRLAGELLEAVRGCDCGAPIVRKYGGDRMLMHLPVPMSFVSVLRN